MQSISARIDDETHAQIEEFADERGSSQSAVVRRLIEKGLDYDDLKNERDRLERQLAAANARSAREEDITEIVEFVEEQRDLTRYQERRQRLLDQAGMFTRWKWKLTGVPVENSED